MWVYIPKESYPSSLESADLISLLNLSSHKPELWLTLSGKATARESSWRGLKTRPWMKELFGMILHPLMASRGAELWIASLEASHARTLAQQEKKQESKKATGQACSMNTSALLTRYDQNSCSWRTSQACWITGQWALFSENWPKGGSMRNGECFQRDRWVAPIKEIESLSWLTPTAMNLEASENRRGKREAYRKSIGRQDAPGSLAEQVGMKWPTPRASEIEETPEQHKLRMEKRVALGKGYISPNLTVTVKKWPTPVRSDFQDRKESENWDGSDLPSVVNKFHTGRQDQVTQNYGEESLNPTQNLRQRWNTPTTMDVVTNRNLENQKATRQNLGNAELSRDMMGEKKKLNPFFVEWLMGKPIGWSLPTPLEQSVYKHWETESALLLEHLHSGFSLKD